ncbi:hypothetical protein CTAYLR_002855 [Chrysophaeum taylorii]|uniref:tRNA (adenine(58)-N(1))-methyltransferase non-catalytic subunit TRM6 n=1 Tax=Chrysophaeum taylorii TaxID=2483200 RepID=A0AAD7U826_9STRA|nr:hypothetical protein CTAYLR_002855 [Chrysophaeum taylorii]
MVDAGDEVVLWTSQGTYLFAEAKVGSTFRWTKRERVRVDALIGAPFGATFEIRGGALVRAAPRGAATTVEDDGERRDNRWLADDNRAQRLDADDLKRMRRDGASGEAIIDALVAGSDTFAHKTQFAQQKWLRRKQNKYLPWVRVLEPRAATIAAAYFSRGNLLPHRVVLRPDTVAQLVARANARDGAKIITVDHSGGVALAAILERIEPSGKALVPHRGPFEALRRCNLTDLDRRVVCFSLDETPPPQGDSLVLVAKTDPIANLDALLPLLCPSAPIVVYSDTVEPLAAAYAHLQASGLATAILLSETWLRDFQVLPNRTHPTMSMSATGGYLLSATKIVVADAA